MTSLSHAPMSPVSSTLVSKVSASCRIATMREELARHHHIRHEVFVREQGLFVETDRDQYDHSAGVIRVLDYAVTHDCGRVANPLLVDGQIMGGVVQGLGTALFEELLYDSDGLPLARGFGEYVLPTAATVPHFVLRHIETPSPLNPLGMKGAGEAGCTGAAAAIVNAIGDALAPFGVMPAGCGPFSPAHVRELLRNAKPREASRC